jgi:hypothetical protein
MVRTTKPTSTLAGSPLADQQRCRELQASLRPSRLTSDPPYAGRRASGLAEQDPCVDRPAAT